MTRTQQRVDSPRPKLVPVENSTPQALGEEQPNGPTKSKRLRNFIVGFLVVGAAIYVWDEIIKYRVIAKRWGVVVPGKIYRSGQISQWMIEPSITKHQIVALIDLTGATPESAQDDHQRKEAEVVQKLDIEHYRFALGGDGTGDIQMYANAVATLVQCEQQGKPVLVHCAAGAQRTGGVVASYRMLIQKQSPQMAYQEMRRYGWSPRKNPDLLTYVNSHMAELAQLLVEKGVLEKVPDPLPLLAPKPHRTGKSTTNEKWVPLAACPTTVRLEVE